ncbi:MAG: hypothetical protein HN348_30750, partial [Proteobacteria bacterium]|nr:hypothetical protein [Pseudomonadota bacterium]
STPGTLVDLDSNPTGWFDYDGNSEGYQYKWYRWNNGSWLDTGVSTAQFPNAQTQRGHLYKLRCTPFDGQVTGTSIESTSLEIVNTAPTVGSCDVNPGSPTTTEDIQTTATGWYDPDNDTPSYGYRWYKNGSIDSGETTATYHATKTAKDDLIYVECVPKDADGDGTATPSATITVANTVPTAPTIELQPTSPASGEGLSVSITSQGTDDDNDAITYYYYWQRDGIPFHNPTYPTTRETLAANTTNRGEEWAVMVFSHDGTDYGGSALDSVTIGNSAPSTVGCSLGPANPTTTEDLLAAGVGFSDPDGDSEGYRFRWYIDGIPNQYIEDETFNASETNKGEEIWVECYPDDGIDVGLPEESNHVFILNSAPGAPTIELNPGSPITDDALSVAITLDAADDDGDSLAYWYYWFVDGVAYDNPSHPSTNPNLSANVVNRDETWMVQVRANDGTVDGAYGTDSVTIGNAKPQITGCFINPSAPETTDDLTVAIQGWSDGDGDTPGYRYAWYSKQGSSWVATGETGATFSDHLTSRGQEYKVRCTPFDGIAEGDAVDSGSKTIDNTPP